MNWNKDIKFPEKKVDSSWKEEASSKKEVLSASQKISANSSSATESTQPRKESVTSQPFVSLLSSLGYQALMHLGEIPNPATHQPELNLDAAREVISLILAVKEKSAGNTSPEETEMLQSLVSELQMKFAAKV